jgi:hypothetical protein
VGTGYSSSSAGDKPDKRKRQDAKQMEEQINELVDGDAIMHLELLEYMTDKFRTNHPTVSPDQQKLLALQVLAGVQQFVKDLKTMFKGRYPNAIRQDLQAVLAVAASKCTDVKGLAELLGTNYQKLLRQKKLYSDFVDGNGSAPPMCLHDIRGVALRSAGWRVAHGRRVAGRRASPAGQSRGTD